MDYAGRLGRGRGESEGIGAGRRNDGAYKLPAAEGCPAVGATLGRVVILGFTTVRRTFSAVRCPCNRHSGLRRIPASYVPGYGNGAGKHRFRLAPE